MRVFLDVGAHVGQTLQAVVDPKFAFDRIVCFEPTAEGRCALARFVDPRVTVEPVGLWKETCERAIFRPGSKGASIFADKNDSDPSGGITVKLVRATDWFRENLRPGDMAWMKLNCEGCECDILDDLLESGEYASTVSVLIFLDAAKVPSQAHRAVEIRSRLAGSGYHNYCFAEDIQESGHRRRIQGWLRRAGAEVSSPSVRVRQLRCDSRRMVVAALQMTLDGGVAPLLRRALPRRTYSILRARWRWLRGQRVTAEWQ